MPKPHLVTAEDTNDSPLRAALVSWVHGSAAQGVLMTDEKLNIRFCNAWLEKQIGIKEADLIGRNLFEVFPDLEARGFDSYFLEALRGQSRVLSHRLHKYLLPMPPSLGAGTFAQMQQRAQISPLLHSNETIGTVTVIEDVTDRVDRENELRTQVDEREQLLASELAARELAEANSRIKDEFLAAVSHEIRAPLNAITGWTQLLLNGNLDPQKAHHALDTIQRNVRSQAQIIEDLLDISRIVAGQMRLDMQPLDLSDSIESALESVLPAANAKKISLVPSVSKRPIYVMGDPSRVQQILWNLLTNAVKFTPLNGRVELVLRDVDGFAELIVRDNGEGMPQDFLPFAFDRFRQADGSSKRKQGGLGLGLSIVKNLVEMHGGTISASSNGEGKGSEFSFMLPLVTAERPSASPTSIGDGTARADLSGCRVLIVEDDEDSREMLDILLSAFNADTQTASTALEALDHLSSFKPDILISDLGMPEIDGYDLIRRVRSLDPEHGGNIPAIALTGYAGPEEMKRVHNAGFNSHLTKPIDQEKLISTINNVRAAGR